MKRFLCLVLLLAFVILPRDAAGAAPAPAGAKPNIIVFLVDDMGWQDTSVSFHKERTEYNERYRTPAMERLAASGMKFTQAYACSVCSPARVSLITGLNAARHRVTNWTLRRNTKTDAKHPSIQVPDWNVNGLSPVPGIEKTVQATPLPMLLRAAGYRTIHVGKAHFGAIGTPGADPKNLGFDVNIAGHAAGGPGSYLASEGFGALLNKDHVWDVPGLQQYHGKDIFLTEALTLEAMKEVDRAAADKTPFFLYMAHYAVHTPYAADRRFIAKYEAEGVHPTEAMYAALVEGMDKSLGDLMNCLERHGIADNTVILLISDNGGLSATGRGPVIHHHNAPLSSGKGSAREGGIRVPMLVRWPGVTRPGSTCGDYIIIEDFFPTILTIAGVAAGDWPGVLDGKSFAPMLKGASGSEKRALFWHYPNVWGPTGPGILPYSGIRKGDWKLIYYHPDQSYELFNLAKDIGETRNLAEKEPGRRRQLAAELAGYLASVAAQMPQDIKTGRTVPLPK